MNRSFDAESRVNSIIVFGYSFWVLQSINSKLANIQD